VVIVLMGPAGAGKTTVGTALAATLGWPFVDADDFHSTENRLRLARGEALTDAERAPWLASLHAEIEQRLARGEPMVLACSALKRSYRDALAPRELRERRQVRFVNLHVSPRRLDERLHARAGHFAPAELLASQLATLEEPAPDEGILTLDGEQSVPALVERIQHALDLVIDR
jgi:gluconokinase